MRSTTRLLALLAATALLLAGCGGDSADTASSKPKAESAAAKSAETAKDTAKVDPDAKLITYEGEDGKTALELLEDAGYDVTVETSDLGSYVSGIGDVESTNSEYWLFSVNGKMPAEGADKYVTKDGDEVEWRYGS